MTAVATMGQLRTTGTPPAGFTTGKGYWLIGVAVDCAPAVPVVYVLTADDAGKLQAQPTSAFVFTPDAPPA